MFVALEPPLEARERGRGLRWRRYHSQRGFARERRVKSRRHLGSSEARGFLRVVDNLFGASGEAMPAHRAFFVRSPCAGLSRLVGRPFMGFRLAISR